MEKAIGGNSSADSKDDEPRLLDRIDQPSDLRQLSREELHRLCDEIRDFVIDVVSKKGGHLGPSLGVVELTVALETALDLPRDRIVWDTGHQAYVHKVLTGRRDQLWSIRQYQGISGFLKRGESEFDAFGAGHASTAISAGVGLATARDLAGQNHNVVAVIGDGAMTGGLAYEAMNNAGQSGRNLLVVLNDNGMSIAPNVGALSNYLTSIRTNPHVKKLRDDSLQVLKKLPLGETVGDLAERFETAVKNFLVPGALFEALGFNYMGPVDGHDLDQLLDLLPYVIERDGPVLLHVLTTKGKGLAHAEAHHESFHGVKPFDRQTGKSLAGPDKPAPAPDYTTVFGDAMLRAGDEIPEVVAITAAMPGGTGLDGFKKKHPGRFFDVGIAEAHGVCFAGALACEGARPVVAIYSTFMQRAFDQIVHDVALQNLPVVFALDRAGLVGADGPTHHGVLDLSYLRCIPGLVIAAPRDGNELRDLLWTALAQSDHPFAIRYPRDRVPAGYAPDRKPQAMDRQALHRLERDYRILLTLEENSVVGGFGAGVLDLLEQDGLSRGGVVRVGLPDEFVTQGTREQLLEEVGLTPARVAATVLDRLDREAVRE